MTANGNRYLNTHQAGEYLGLSPRTLDRYRVKGSGPIYHRFGGRIRYVTEDLDAWAENRRRTSTSDDGTALAGARR